MPTMKVTTSAAMRARDVSRPHAEHLAFAEAAEAKAASSRSGTPPGPALVDVPSAVNVPSAVDAASAGRDGERADRGPRRPGGARRRGHPRGSGQGRTPSR